MEQELVYYLLYNHRTWTRPVFRANKVMDVHASIFLTSIYDVVYASCSVYRAYEQVTAEAESHTMQEFENYSIMTKNQAKMNMLLQGWQDELLTWNPQEFNNVTEIRLPWHLIWTPDIVLVNAVGSGKGHKDVNIILYHFGSVYWCPPARFRSICRLDVTWFPYDEQNCYMIFGSSSYDGNEVRLSGYRNDSFIKEYVESGKFILISIKQEIVKFNYPQDETFIVYRLHIRRRTLYYVYSSMLPCIFLSILTATVFLAPPASNQKINLGITTLLSLYVYSSMLAEKMPEISDSVPLLGVYISLVTMFTTVSLISTVFILGIYDRDFGAYPPYCLDRTVVLIAKLICMKVPYYENYKQIHKRKRRRNIREFRSISQELQQKEAECNCSNCRNPIQYEKLEKIRADIKEAIGTNEALQESTEESALTKAWKRIAMIIDRLLLIVFPVLVVASILAFLLLAPMFQKLKIGQNWWEKPFYKEE